jgi:esterase/lipase
MKKDKAIICIHGMRTGRYHDFAFFERMAKKRYPDYDVQLLEYYDPLDKSTINYKKYYETCVSELKRLSKGYKEVTVMGYSIGAPFSLLAFHEKIKNVKNVVLLSPTFGMST